MKTRIATPRRSTWRDRFLQIAREVEGAAPRAPAHPAGLRLRARMAGFAALRRAH